MGREAELAELSRHLLTTGEEPAAVAICALQGMPGVGKTYLAEQFAAENAEAFPGGLVRLVLDPTQPKALSETQILKDLADRLRISPSPVRLAERLRDALLAPRALLLIENVDSPEAARAVSPLARNLAGCALLVTGRYRELGRDPGSGWRCLDIAPWAEYLALEQLSLELGNARMPEEADCRKLVYELGYLPLGIHLAAGYLRRRSVDTFLHLLKKERLALGPLDATDPALQGRATLAATFEVSLQLLKTDLGKDEESFRGFQALGFAPAAGFGSSLGAAVAELPSVDFEELAARAEGLSLLDPMVERRDRAWKLHPLLAELLRSQARDLAEPILKGITDWFVHRLSKLSNEEAEEQGRRWKEVQREVDALVSWLPQVKAEDGARVERAGSWYATLNGPFSAWVTFCEIALAGELSSEERSNFLWTLAMVAKRAGLLDRAMAIAQTKYRLDTERGKDREAALAQGVIADIFQARGQLDEALRIRQEEELPVYEKLGDIRSRAVTMGKIADIFQARGQLDEALRIRQEEELPVYEKLGDIRERAVTMGKIADIFQARGQLDEALRIRQEEALPVYEKLGDIRSRAVTMGKIADIFQARGQLDEALRIRQEEELPVYEKLGDIRERAVTMGKIADIFQARGQLDEALRIRQEEELPVYEKLGDIRSRAVTMGKIADIFQARGQLDEALRIRQEEELPVYEKLGDIRERAVTMGKIADIFQARGQLDEALRIRQEEELPVYEKLGDIRSRAVTMGKIADIFQARGQLDEALRIRQEEALPVYEKLGDIRSRAVTMGKIADILRGPGPARRGVADPPGGGASRLREAGRHPVAGGDDGTDRRHLPGPGPARRGVADPPGGGASRLREAGSQERPSCRTRQSRPDPPEARAARETVRPPIPFSFRPWPTRGRCGSRKPHRSRPSSQRHGLSRVAPEP